MRNKLNFDFGEVLIFDNYIVVEMKEGIVVKPEYNQNLIDVRDNYFFDRPFGYISHRKNSYSVNPNIYLKTSKISNLIGFAIVIDSDKKIDNSLLEQKFLKQPIKTFNTIEKAVAWINSLIN